MVDRVAGISFGEICANKCTMCALTKGFDRDRRKSGVSRFRESRRCGQCPAESFKCVQATLSKPFTLNNHPVVVPVREQIAGLPKFEQILIV